MCKIDVQFCGGPDQDEHVAAMIFGLEEAATDDDDEDEATCSACDAECSGHY